ncbi:hypothetical protein M1397_00825 [Candidatus Marsarchaeota archaeon]|nr:hypothetical protein [Candidatus Marsarchaeota archaeon]
MNNKSKSLVGIIMGIIILIADLYWTYTSYSVPTWLALGIIILVADIIWLVIDASFMKK